MLNKLKTDFAKYSLRIRTKKCIRHFVGKIILLLQINIYLFILEAKKEDDDGGGVAVVSSSCIVIIAGVLAVDLTWRRLFG